MCVFDAHTSYCFQGKPLLEASQPLGFPDFKEKPWKSGNILIFHWKTQHSSIFSLIFMVFPRNQENLEAAGARLVKVAAYQENQENQEKYWFCIEKHINLVFFFRFSWFSGHQKTRKIRKNIDFELKNTSILCFFFGFSWFFWFSGHPTCWDQPACGFSGFQGKTRKIIKNIDFAL